MAYVQHRCVSVHCACCALSVSSSLCVFRRRGLSRNVTRCEACAVAHEPRQPKEARDPAQPPLRYTEPSAPSLYALLGSRGSASPPVSCVAMDKFVLGILRPEFGMLTSLWYFEIAHDQHQLCLEFFVPQAMKNSNFLVRDTRVPGILSGCSRPAPL